MPRPNHGCDVDTVLPHEASRLGTRTERSCPRFLGLSGSPFGRPQQCRFLEGERRREGFTPPCKVFKQRWKHLETINSRKMFHFLPVFSNQTIRHVDVSLIRLMARPSHHAVHFLQELRDILSGPSDVPITRSFPARHAPTGKRQVCHGNPPEEDPFHGNPRLDDL